MDDVDTQPEIDYPTYSSVDFLSDVYMNEQDYKTLVNVLKNEEKILFYKAHLALEKTFTAKRLAYSIIGAKNPDRVQMIQFHQSYSYEDFIEDTDQPKMDSQLKRALFTNSVNWQKKMMKMIISLSLMKSIVVI